MKNNFATKLLVVSLALCIGLALTACSITSVVQKAQTDLNLVKGGITTATNLIPTLQQINPELGTVVSAFTSKAGPLTDSALAACANYLSKPSGDNYQNLLNVTDSIVQ